MTDLSPALDRIFGKHVTALSLDDLVDALRREGALDDTPEAVTTLKKALADDPDFIQLGCERYTRSAWVWPESSILGRALHAIKALGGRGTNQDIALLTGINHRKISNALTMTGGRFVTKTARATWRLAVDELPIEGKDIQPRHRDDMPVCSLSAEHLTPQRSALLALMNLGRFTSPQGILNEIRRLRLPTYEPETAAETLTRDLDRLPYVERFQGDYRIEPGFLSTLTWGQLLELCVAAHRRPITSSEAITWFEDRGVRVPNEHSTINTAFRASERLLKDAHGVLELPGFSGDEFDQIADTVLRTLAEHREGISAQGVARLLSISPEIVKAVFRLRKEDVTFAGGVFYPAGFAPVAMETTKQDLIVQAVGEIGGEVSTSQVRAHLRERGVKVGISLISNVLRGDSRVERTEPGRFRLAAPKLAKAA